MKKFYLLTKTLLVAALLCVGASNVWADVNFGTEATVSTTTTWVFNDLESVDAGIAQIGSTSIYSRATSGRGVVTFETSGAINSFTFSDGYHVPSITKCAVMTSKGNRNPTFNVTAGNIDSNGAAHNSNVANPYFAFNATEGGTLYVYLSTPEKVADTDNEANAEIRFWDGSTSTQEAVTSTSGVQELKATTTSGGVFYIGATAHKFGSFKVYAIRFVPTSEKKDEWVYIGETGYATWGNNSGKDIESLPTGLTAYKATAGAAGSGTVTLTSLDGMRRGQGYVLKGTANTNYPLTYGGTSLPDTYNGGDMLRVSADMADFAATITGGDSRTRYRYILGNDNGTAMFFTPSGSGTLRKGKAYLQTLKDLTSDSSPARGIKIVFNDDITGINEAQATSAEAAQKNGKFIENGTLVIYKNGMKYNINGQLIK